MKKLMILASMLAALLVSAIPVLAQEGPPPQNEAVVTPVGVLGEPYTVGQDPTVEYPLTDEITGTEYALVGLDNVDLDAYVGQRVTIDGVLAPAVVPDGSPTPAFVNQIFPTGEPMPADEPSTGDDNDAVEPIYGTEGYDELSGTQGDDIILGLGSGDVISEGRGNDLLRGGGGWDYIVGGYGDDALYGESGSDWLDGGAGSDMVVGDAGDDYVDGGTGNDIVGGASGNDAVYGYKGVDELFGGQGNDLLYSAGDEAEDTVSGGPGYDVCVVDEKDTVEGGCEEVYAY